MHLHLLGCLYEEHVFLAAIFHELCKAIMNVYHYFLLVYLTLGQFSLKFLNEMSCWKLFVNNCQQVGYRGREEGFFLL